MHWTDQSIKNQIIAIELCYNIPVLNPKNKLKAFRDIEKFEMFPIRTASYFVKEYATNW